MITMIKQKNQELLDLKNKSGIYQIINLNNKKRYIGSANDLYNRFRQHLSSLRRQKHSNLYLQRSFIKYTGNNFEFSIIEFCEKESLLKREQYYLDIIKPEYNISISSTAPMAGRKHSSETLEKLKGREVWNKGIPRTEDEKLLMSKRRREEIKKKPPEWHKMISKIRSETSPKYWKGKKLPDHVIRKLIEYGKSISQKIKCNETGEIFNSQKECSIKLNIRQGHIAEQLSGKRLRVSGKYTFTRITNEDI